MSEKALASAVLHLVADDYHSPEPVKKASREWRDWNEARLFCTQAKGPWAKSREAWCALAGIDPDAFRERCMNSQVAAECNGLTVEPFSVSHLKSIKINQDG